MRIEDVYDEVPYDEYLEQMFRIIKVGILLGKSNSQIAKEADLRMKGSTKYRTDIIQDLRDILESKKKRWRGKVLAHKHQKDIEKLIHKIR